MKTIEKSMITGFIFSALLTMTGFFGNCQNINNKIFRLHVLANSDSIEDQQLKLKVRDRILADSNEKFSGASSKENAKQAAILSMEDIKNCAQDEIQKLGYNYPVEISVTNSLFNTRNYGDITLPAGKYDALKISIGEGKGKNWWCVLYPVVCISAASEKSNNDQIENILSESETDLVKGKNNYEIKFKIVEWYENIRNIFPRLRG
jgi:stage II sporulation protein R